MTKWPVQWTTHRTTQKHVEHHDATEFRNKLFLLHCQYIFTLSYMAEIFISKKWQNYKLRPVSKSFSCGVYVVTLYTVLTYLWLLCLPAIDCQTFTMTGGSVTFSGTGEGSTAVVTCDPGLFADNGEQKMTVTCRPTGKWTIPNPECSGWSRAFVTS